MNCVELTPRMSYPSHSPRTPGTSHPGHGPRTPQTSHPGHGPWMPWMSHPGHGPWTPQTSHSSHGPRMPQTSYPGHGPAPAGCASFTEVTVDGVPVPPRDCSHLGVKLGGHLFHIPTPWAPNTSMPGHRQSQNLGGGRSHEVTEATARQRPACVLNRHKRRCWKLH